MEEIARQLGNNRLAKGTINLFSEHSLCKSCELVIKQFKKKYPKVKIRVFTKAQYYNNL